MVKPENDPWGTVDTKFERIHSLARQRDIEGVRCELASGVDVDILNERALNGDGGNTALWFAAQGSAPESVPLARLLVESGANINRVCEHGYTPMHMAALWGHLQLVRFFVDSGADPFPESDVDGTPLNMAQKAGRAQVIEYLESLREET